MAECHAKLEQREDMIKFLGKVDPETLSTANTLKYNNLMKLSTDWPE
jgi:flagellar basal body L-ring protein FlgH